MKRRQFLLAAAIASICSHKVLGKENTNDYFTHIGAQKYASNFLSNHPDFLSFLENESKSLSSLGYQQSNEYYAVNQMVFIPYILKVDSLIIDKQYLVINTTAGRNCQKITTLSLDFLNTVERASLNTQFNSKSLKDMLIPVINKRNKASQMYLTKAGDVSYQLKILSSHNEHTLCITSDKIKFPFSFKSSNEGLIS